MTIAMEEKCSLENFGFENLAFVDGLAHVSGFCISISDLIIA